MDLLRQDREHDLMIKASETIGDVSLNEPSRPGPGVGHLPQRGMTASTRPEPAGRVQG